LRGTTAFGVVGSSIPSSTEFETFALTEGAVDFAVETVALTELVPTEFAFGTNFVGGGVDRTGDDVVVARVLVAVVSRCVVVVDTECSVNVFEATGELVKVKTRTSSSSGLDHIRRCALRKVKRGVVMSLAG
jgi:hypothetical protein